MRNRLPRASRTGTYRLAAPLVAAGLLLAACGNDSADDAGVDVEIRVLAPPR